MEGVEEVMAAAVGHLAEALVQEGYRELAGQAAEVFLALGRPPIVAIA